MRRTHALGKRIITGVYDKFPVDNKIEAKEIKPLCA
jgi:hypothetical protein